MLVHIVLPLIYAVFIYKKTPLYSSAFFNFMDYSSFHFFILLILVVVFLAVIQ